MGIPTGAAGTKATLNIMRGLIRVGKKTLPVRLLALKLVRRDGEKQWIQEVTSVHRFVRDKIRYVRDIRGVETLQTPEKTLELTQGDCDDKSILVASLLESIGHPTRIVAVGMTPNCFSHVLIETLIGSKWVAVETTEPVRLGWFPPNVKKVLRVHN